MRIHIVQKGETLWRIAKQYGIGLDELKRLNAHLANPDYIVPGMEIILPEGSAASKSAMTKEQMTLPKSTKEMITAPKQQLTKEQLTKEVPKEIPKVVETAPIPEPVPMPMPQVELTPQFQFDFAPQMHFEQPKAAPAPAPQPAPQPVPAPQPIYIQVPVPQVETKVETTVEKEVEYIQVPVPQIIYIPYIPQQPCIQHKPCGCHEQAYYHNPCGCQEQQFYHHNLCGCQEQQFYHQDPCGGHEQPYYQQAPFEQTDYEYQQMPQQQYDCGCGGGEYPSAEMMPYGLPYFEPNYDVAPMADVSPAMEYVDENHDGLPDWLLDSSEMKAKMGDQDCEPNAAPQMYEEFNPYGNVADQGQVAGYYQDGNNYGNVAYPYAQNHYGPFNTQQMMQPNCQGYPYNPYLSQNKPWNY
ncbi:MAG TPA: LysM peptidoglycan-binding domain-containing protein [Ureibacillus sp.]|nr:LysM peptidoglycan-binding domain-containing protein [Ureibacillus sp.]